MLEPEARIFDMVRAELGRARQKFPNTKHLLHAFTEEAGEVIKAFLDLHYKGGADERVKEIVQTIAMGVRLIVEGDPDFTLPSLDLL